MNHTQPEQEPGQNDVHGNLAAEILNQQALAEGLRQMPSLHQSFLSSLVQCITENAWSLRLVLLFLTFLVLQTVHINTVKRIQYDLTAFLLEHEALEIGKEAEQTSQFMAKYGKCG